MGRTKKTIINAVVSFLNLFAKGLTGLVVMRFFLGYLGSDYNGLNATVSQVILLVSLVSSSFTTASLVSLYKPYNEGDWEMINLILSTSRRAYRLIGVGMVVFGALVCVCYAVTVQSDAPFLVIVVVLLLALASSVFNVVVVNVYSLVFQVSQTEYVVTGISFVYTILVMPVVCSAIVLTSDIVVVRACYVVLEMLSGCVIALYARRKFRLISFSGEYDYALVRGTKDVFATSLTGIVYRSAPTLFLSSLVGTTATSVYYVYESVIALVRNVVHVIIAAPKNAMGQVIHEHDDRNTIALFRQYEYVTLASATVFLSAVCVVIMPFVDLYTAGINDADYLDVSTAFLLASAAFVELSHIPSGLVLQLSGEFRIVRNIQYFALAVLSLLLILLGAVFSLRGVLIAVLATAGVLMTLEVRYVHVKIFHDSPVHFIRVFAPHAGIFLAFCALGVTVSMGFDGGYVELVVWGMLALFASVAVTLLVGRVIFSVELQGVCKRLKSAISSK